MCSLRVVFLITVSYTPCHFLGLCEIPISIFFKQQGFKIKVYEKPGVPLKRLLQRSDPFKPRQCERKNCLVCKAEGRGSYGVTYEIKCTEGGDVYVAETSRSAYTRVTKHLKSLDNKEERSALWKHYREKHESKIQTLKMPEFLRYFHCLIF